jgi:hypothetical protein
MLADRILKRLLTVTTALANESSPPDGGSERPATVADPVHGWFNFVSRSYAPSRWFSLALLHSRRRAILSEYCRDFGSLRDRPPNLRTEMD